MKYSKHLSFWAFFCLLLTSCAGRYPDCISSIEPSPSIEFHKELIVIDAGHGGKDPGTQNKTYGYQEKEYTIQTAHYLRRALTQMGYQTLMTRMHDTYVPLETRAEIANQLEADLFVSIHYNHSPKKEVEGVEIYAYKEKKSLSSNRVTLSKQLGQRILTRVIEETGAQSRGLKTENFCVLRETKMPAILIEGGFLSNEKERKKIQNPKYVESIAKGMAEGIDHYLAEMRR